MLYMHTYNYSRLLRIKSITDPKRTQLMFQLLSIYWIQLWYNWSEVNVENLGALTPAPTPIRTGTIDPDYSSAASSLGLQIGTFFIAVNVCLLTLW